MPVNKYLKYNLVFLKSEDSDPISALLHVTDWTTIQGKAQLHCIMNV